MTQTVRALVVAGTHSGCGKTTITLGLMAALVRRGLTVAPFKVGPDFIDPGHHTRVTGCESRNLDGWMLSQKVNRDCFHARAAFADIAIVEGVMGLFDGYDGRSEAGSTAQMAKWLGIPVLLVVNARSMARSAAALVQGFARFDPAVSFAGVVFNGVGSPVHLEYLTQALDGAGTLRCLGGVPRNDRVAIPERHLGLVTAEDHGLDVRTRDALADLVEQAMDLDGLLQSLPVIPLSPRPAPAPAPSAVRIAVARDRAFCFYYPENLEMLAAWGAELVFFSPMTDTSLPEGCDGIYFGGGYPELHARALSANTVLRAHVLAACRQGMPIYGECGGFMYLCETLVDLNGIAYPMAGCFEFVSRMAGTRKGLGYREITLNQDTILGPAGLTARGHEFHYSALDPHEQSGIYASRDRSGTVRTAPGFQVHQCVGSYVHLHFGSQPEVPQALVQACRKFRVRLCEG